MPGTENVDYSCSIWPIFMILFFLNIPRNGVYFDLCQMKMSIMHPNIENFIFSCNNTKYVYID